MELYSEGHCYFCDEYFSQKEIGRHLATHLKKKENDEKEIKKNPFTHIVIDWDAMFLHLLVRNTCKMEEIDNFLRVIWLECCGHLSGFHIKKGEEIEMDDIVGDVLMPKVKLIHSYDYGTTTKTYIRSIKVYDLDFEDDDIILLSRSEPLKIMCSICDKKVATTLCSVCIWNSDSHYFCDVCAKKHSKTCEDFDEYARMKVVNSPRMGQCGYEGGTFDEDRDGVYIERKIIQEK